MERSEPIRTLVVDDEPLAREGLVALLTHDPDLEVMHPCANGQDAVDRIKRERPSLVLLDIQMPEMNGFEVLEAIGPNQMPQVVFVTAYDRFAVRAFDVHAVDYLLKPYDDVRLWAAIARAKKAICAPDDAALAHRLERLLDEQTGARLAEKGNRDYRRRFLIKTGDKSIVVSVDQIDWIEAADYYVRLHVGSRRYIHRISMTQLEQELDPTHFHRVHRSSIVNLNRVREVQPYFKGDEVVVLLDGRTTLQMSRSRRAGFLAALGHR